MSDGTRLLAILRIGNNTSCRGEGISLQEAIRRTDYKRIRRHFSSADVIPLISGNPDLISQWIMYSEDKRTSGGFWIDGESFRVGTLAPDQPVFQYSSLEEAVAEFVVKELDFWSGIN